MVATQSVAMDLGAQRGTPRAPLGTNRYHKTPQWPRNPPIGRSFRSRSHMKSHPKERNLESVSHVSTSILRMRARRIF